MLENKLELNQLSTEERNSILSICRSFNDIFLLEGDKLSVTDATSDQINTIPNSKPIFCKPYRLPQAVKQEVIKQIITNHTFMSEG